MNDVTCRVPRCGRGGGDAAVGRTEAKAVELGHSGGPHHQGEAGGVGRSSEGGLASPQQLTEPMAGRVWAGHLNSRRLVGQQPGSPTLPRVPQW